MRRLLLPALVIGMLLVVGVLFRNSDPPFGTTLQTGDEARRPDQMGRRNPLGVPGTGPSDSSGDAVFRRRLQELKRWSSPFRGFVVEGRVLSSGEDLVAGARIAVYLSKNPATEEFEELTLEAFSSLQGHYRLDSSEPLDGWIVASKAGYTSVEEKIQLVDPGVDQRDISISPAEGIVQGMASDLFTSVPLPNVRIKWFMPDDVPRVDPSSVSPRITFTDQMGRYELTDLPTGRGALEASFPGLFETTKTVDLEAGMNQIDISLVRGDSFTLKVEGQDGEAIAHALVERPDGQTVASDAEGVVEMALLPEYPTIHCRIWAEGYLRLEADMDAGAGFRVVRLEPEPEVHGWVVSSTGDAVANARLNPHGTRGIASHLEKPVHSDHSGAFSFGVSYPPLQKIEVSHPEYIEELIRFGEHPSEPLVIRLRLKETALAGSVINQDGLPVRRFTVMLVSVDPDTRRLQPLDPDTRRLSKFFDDSEGRFSISSVAAGRYRIFVYASGPSESPRELIILGAKQQIVELTRGNITRISFRMTEESRVPRRQLQGFPGAGVLGKTSRHR